MLSMKAKYGLRALTALAREHGEGPMLIADLAASEAIPKKFLELILLDLKRKGILQSKKGKGGGYNLSRAPSNISIGEVIRALDGPLALLPCVSQSAYQRCDECVDELTCGIRHVMKEVGTPPRESWTAQHSKPSDAQPADARIRRARDVPHLNVPVQSDMTQNSIRRRRIHALAGILALAMLTSQCGSGADAPGSDTVTLLNVSYDPTREFYQDVNAAFERNWKRRPAPQLRSGNLTAGRESRRAL